MLIVHRFLQSSDGDTKKKLVWFNVLVWMSLHTFQASGLMLEENTLVAEKNTVNTFKLDLKPASFRSL